MKKIDIDEIFCRFSDENPEPSTELSYKNTFTLLIAIVLSAQSTDVSVNKATPLLFDIADTPEKMVALGETTIKKYIKTIGLYNTKASNIISLSEMLIKDFNSNIPSNRENLEKLPGVGRKTANVLINCAFGGSTIAVDTHVQRVSNRIGLVKTKTPLQTEDALEKTIPDKWKRHLNHWIVLHGRYICKARKPVCASCIIVDLCLFKEKT